MFASLAARETFVVDANLASRTQGNVIESSHKHSCFLDANFASEIKKKQCFLNNVY